MVREDGRDFFCVGVGTVDIGLGDSANASRPAGNEYLKGTGSVSGAGHELLKVAPALAPAGVTAELGTTPTPRLTTMPSRRSSDAKVYAQLEMAFEKSGQHSLVHVLFSESEHVWEMISRLLDLEIPFLAKAWGEGGVSKETIKRFVQKFILNERLANEVVGSSHREQHGYPGRFEKASKGVQRILAWEDFVQHESANVDTSSRSRIIVNIITRVYQRQETSLVIGHGRGSLYFPVNGHR
ncbi:hypothetical protein BU17DRAFT_71886 [Hysterangium stoloniferum]|nr:hypothetical protein BU17DRAFT_71886 [Hysterangium stoloniferum]